MFVISRRRFLQAAALVLAKSCLPATRAAEILTPVAKAQPIAVSFDHLVREEYQHRHAAMIGVAMGRRRDQFVLEALGA